MKVAHGGDLIERGVLETVGHVDDDDDGVYVYVREKTTKSNTFLFPGKGAGVIYAEVVRNKARASGWLNQLRLSHQQEQLIS